MSTLAPRVHEMGSACMMMPMLAAPASFSICSSTYGLEAPVIEPFYPSPSAPPEILTCAYNPDRGVSRICWRVDTKHLKGRNPRLVSPPFALSFGEHVPLATFRMMIQAESIDRAQDRKSFSKRALSTISLKCESELRGYHVLVDF